MLEDKKIGYGVMEFGKMEYWLSPRTIPKYGSSESFTPINEKTRATEEKKMERKNINRGYKQLRVWNDAVDLYVLSCKFFLSFPFELKKTAGNCIDAAHSISRNIAEGYCRKSIREYLQFLNIALASSGEFHSCITSFIEQIKLQRKFMRN